MPMLVFFVNFIKIITADWVLVGSSFTGTTYSTNGWVGQYNMSNCNTNPLTYVKIGYYGWYYQKDYYSRSFQQRIIYDLYYDNANSTIQSFMKGSYYDYLTGQWNNFQYFQYYQSDLVQLSNRICTGGSDYAFNLNTYVFTTNMKTVRFSISFSCSKNYDDRDYVTLGLRNILVYANICHPTCVTCFGSDNNQCLSCYYSTPFSGQCNCHPEHQFAMLQVGCVQECPRTNYISDQNKNCIIDKRIIAKSVYFAPSQTLQSFSPFIFIQDPSHINIRGLISRDCNYHYDYVGQLQFKEGLSLQINTITALKFIRLRVTFIFMLQADSTITVYCNHVQQYQIKQTGTDFYFINSTSISTKIGQTVECNEIAVRLETIFKSDTLNPLIEFKGSLSSLGEYWGFFNVTIDAGRCQENCQVCSDFSKCSQCVTGYVLYQDKCVVSCPIHSSNCIDYSDEYECIFLFLTQDSRYLAKGFYDLTMTTEQITLFIDSVTNSGTNFKTGQFFSFFPDKFVLGGVMVWYDASYIKQFSITEPHYAISIRFNFTFGDQYPGEFIYYIESTSYGPYTIPSSIGQNLVGKLTDEITQFFYIYLNPHTSNTVDIEFKCQAPASFDIRDGFCAISDYFIVVHYVTNIINQCPPFCASCSSSTVCTSWYSGYTSSTCASTEYLSFDEITQTYSCKSCNPTICSLSSLIQNICIDCAYQNQSPPPHNYLADSTYFPCNQYCLECYGPSYSNCLSCETQSKRKLQNSKCVCETGYYDDGINIQCYPICGDGVTTIGEDCDDGNFNPHDGCDRCKFACDLECEECTLGICWQCIQGYYLLQNNCFPICNDNLQVTSEQCEDSNLTPYDGCFNCHYSCSANCIKCVKGVCQQCDELQGWYLQLDNSCQPLCGDNIVVIPYEICDNQSNFIFDECFQCHYKCSQYCSVCVQGQCIICDSGYELVSKIKQCVPICGDSIRLLTQVCDDDNNLPDDGCYNCNLHCQSSCTNCTIYGCLECNTQGWELNSITQKCQTICGDGIIVQDYEECDDLISEKCYQCKFLCQVSCQDCYHGNCKQCQKGWYLNEIDEYCYKQSGDSLVLGMEQCDDSNNTDFDGCYLSRNSCQQNCILCQFGKCQKCKIGYQNIDGQCFEIHNDGVLVESEQCDDANLVPFDGCRDSKYDCPLFCSSCVRGQCLECKKGYTQFDWHHNQCLSICGDKIVVFEEECDDGNSQPFDGCFKCKYSCPLECSKCEKGKCELCKEGYYINKKTNECLSYCGDLIVRQNEQCDDLSERCKDCQYVCDEFCTNCVNGKCYNCSEKGLQTNEITESCQPICGDGIVIGYEQCDDANNIREDGCHECYFECQKACTKCVKGFCQECNIGWDLIWNYCVPICGDKYVVIDYEDCDDGNTIPFDGCFDCKYQCEEQCTDCREGVCYACNNLGWTIRNHICLVNCGDGYVMPDLEQCDDGNDIEFDGCFQCEYSCDKMCTLCLQGICYECDHLGWIIEKNKCIPYCGDGLIVGYEQCDDQNYNEYDGCNNCTFACDRYCTDCQEEVCLQCQIGRYVDFNICQAICGDGYLVDAVEQCDDGNDVNGDGCDSLCKVETDWVCLINQAKMSVCLYSQQPKFELSLITTNPEDIEDVKVTFTQKMKLSSSISGELKDLVLVNILNLENSGFMISKSFENTPLKEEATNLVLLIKINFTIPIDNPVLTIKFVNDPLVSEYNLTLQQNEGSLQLLTPMVLSTAQKAVAESSQAINQALIYSLVGISSLCILTGSSDIFWNLMDQLQYLSYVKYINIFFPSNLNIYYDVYKLVTISPLISRLGINKVFDILDGDKTYYVAPQNKFQKDGLNAYFYINFQSFLFVFIGAFIGYCITKYTAQLLYKLGPQDFSYLNLRFSRMVYQLRRILKNKAKQFYYNGLLRIVMANCYDISFACAFQLANYSGNDFVLIINYYLAVIVLVIQSGISLLFIGIMNDFLNKTALKKQSEYDALFEGVQIGKTTWVMQYNSLLLIKKQIFIFLIVFMQQDGQIQTLCIAFLQTIFLTYFILSKPLTNKFEFYKSLITECLIIFNTITFLVYSYRDDFSLTISDVINLGWIHIFTSSMILVISLIFDFIKQGKILIQKIKKNFQKGPKIDDKNSAVVFFY